MENSVYNFTINIDWKLINIISQIDRFDAAWSAIERKEGRSLKELKSIATVRSVGASTRIEGSKMSDEEVDVLLQEIDITKLQERDAQEVVGYFETLDIISESINDIEITENNIKNLHNILMKHSQKDQWHKGNYKQHSNAVEAHLPDGTKQIVFQTTEAGFPTEDAMRNLIDWYTNDKTTHPLVKCSLFTYEFLSIHPFEDGNGRIGRLLEKWFIAQKLGSKVWFMQSEKNYYDNHQTYYNNIRRLGLDYEELNYDEAMPFLQMLPKAIGSNG